MGFQNPPPMTHRRNVGDGSIEYCSLCSIKTTVKPFLIGRIRRIFVIIFSYFFAYRFTLDILSHCQHLLSVLCRSRNRLALRNYPGRQDYRNVRRHHLHATTCTPGILPQERRPQSAYPPEPKCRFLLHVYPLHLLLTKVAESIFCRFPAACRHQSALPSSHPSALVGCETVCRRNVIMVFHPYITFAPAFS